MVMSETDKIINGVIEGLQAKGLVIVPETLALEALELKKAKKTNLQKSVFIWRLPCSSLFMPLL